MNYSEKLLDPRWQKKRLEVLERAGWKCQACSQEAKTLHVHHLIYTAKEPWEEPNENLECLCEDCHGHREQFNDFFGRSAVRTCTCMIIWIRLKKSLETKEGARAVQKLLEPWSELKNDPQDVSVTGSGLASTLFTHKLT